MKNKKLSVKTTNRIFMFGCLPIILLLVVVIVISISIDEPEVPLTKEEQRKEYVENQFSDWDGSHPALTKLIKQAMNDPKSYEHVETGFWDKGDYLLVQTKYRGNNAFGAKVLGIVKAKVDFNGNVIEIIEQ